MTTADQPPLSDEMLRALLDTYRGLYTVGYDEVLRQLERKTIFGRGRRRTSSRSCRSLTDVLFSAAPGRCRLL